MSIEAPVSGYPLTRKVSKRFFLDLLRVDGLRIQVEDFLSTIAATEAMESWKSLYEAFHDGVPGYAGMSDVELVNELFKIFAGKTIKVFLENFRPPRS